MITQTQETYERRIAILRRLGAEINELSCGTCKETFVDSEPLGGRTWKLVTMSVGSKHPDYGSRCFCSERCAQTAFDKHRGSSSAWIEGYEPPPKKGQNW